MDGSLITPTSSGHDSPWLEKRNDVHLGSRKGSTVGDVTFSAFIVECSVCQQPWEVSTEMFAAPGHHIQVPDHPMLDRTNGSITAIPCAGTTATGFGYGERSDWEHHWPVRHVGRVRPAVLNGSAVRLA